MRSNVAVKNLVTAYHSSCLQKNGNERGDHGAIPASPPRSDEAGKWVSPKQPFATDSNGSKETFSGKVNWLARLVKLLAGIGQQAGNSQMASGTAEHSACNPGCAVLSVERTIRIRLPVFDREVRRLPRQTLGEFVRSLALAPIFGRMHSPRRIDAGMGPPGLEPGTSGL